MYTGKTEEEDNVGTPGDQQDQVCPVKGLSAHVVFNLTCCLHGKNYMVFVDNCFSSVDVFDPFQRTNFLPPALKGLKLANQDNSKFAHFQNLVCTIWMDKDKSKNVALLSTQFSLNQFEKVERREKIQAETRAILKIIMIDKPKAIQ